MFRVFFMLLVLFVATFVIGTLWVKVIYPFLFGEAIEDKLDDAVHQKMMSEADKKAKQILESEVESES